MVCACWLYEEDALLGSFCLVDCMRKNVFYISKHSLSSQFPGFLCQFYCWLCMWYAHVDCIRRMPCWVFFALLTVWESCLIHLETYSVESISWISAILFLGFCMWSAQIVCMRKMPCCTLLGIFGLVDCMRKMPCWAFSGESIFEALEPLLFFFFGMWRVQNWV